MSSRALPKSITTITPPFPFLFGRYQTASTSVPYFQVVMTFPEAAEFIKPVRSMPGYNKQEWYIEELFQRDVDHDRVKKDIVPYLRGDNPQFFNSITVALLPYKENSLSTFKGAWKAHDFHPSGIVTDKNRFLPGCVSRHKFGPVTAEYFEVDTPPSEQIEGRLYWNTQQLFPVAIDGQHRLEAIRSLINSGSTDQRLSETRVPVILLLLDEKLGFIPDSNHDNGLLGAIRRIFIDLNKHAKVVDRPRQILLDDYDPTALAVRGLIGNQVITGISELEKSVKPTIPLSLVDWHSNSAKVDQGPYLTSLFILDYFVQKAAGLQWNVSSNSYSTAKSRLRKIRDLVLDSANNDTIKDLLDSLIDTVQACDDDGRPFQLSVDDCKTIGDHFANTYSSCLCTLLTELTPYKTLIERRKSGNTFTVEFANWASESIMGEGMSSAAGKSSAADDDTTIAKYGVALQEMEVLKNDFKLAFAVVFQKACLHSICLYLDGVDTFFLDSVGASKADEQLLPGSSKLNSTMKSPTGLDDILRNRTVALVETLNCLYQQDPDLYNHTMIVPKSKPKAEFWLGTMTKNGTDIDHSAKAVDRTSIILSLLVYMHLYRKRLPDNSWDDFVSDIDKGDEHMDSAAGVYRLATAQLNDKYSVSYFALRARHPGITEFRKEQHLNEINRRLSYMFELLGKDM